MKKALFYGILASFFFAFTFLLNRSMHLAGYWLWSACLRYLFTFPILAAVLAISGKKQKTRPLSHTWAEITKAPGEWFLWSSVGFVLFYAPLTFGSTFGESWLAAATWQLTIVAGILLTPLWGKPIPIRNLSWSCLILAGVFLLQVPNMRQMNWRLGINTDSHSHCSFLLSPGEPESHEPGFQRYLYPGTGLCHDFM